VTTTTVAAASLFSEELLTSPLARDAACSVLAVAGATAWLAVWTGLASAQLIDPKLSRKIIHCGSAPLFLCVWPLYSVDAHARFVAATVPLLNLGRLVAAGLFAPVRRDESDDEKSPLVAAVSRSGDPKEVLAGPTIYCLVLVLATVLGWRSSVPAVVAVSQMAVGDGLADIVGRRFGERNKWPFCPDKSVAGSAAFVLGATVSSCLLVAWFALTGCLSLPLDPLTFALRAFLISLACAAVELLPGLDDNISVPVVGAFLAHLLLR